MKKLTYFILDTKGQNPKKFILHDQDIVERYKSIQEKHIKTSDIHLTDEEIMMIIRKKGAIEITPDLIKQKRLEKGFTQIQMAIACKVGYNTYRNWELGATTPNKENVHKLTQVLGLFD
jgi:DNA-binding transcriptional regulator YiaG